METSLPSIPMALENHLENSSLGLTSPHLEQRFFA